MKVIFLDIDGVLNSQKYFIENHQDNLIYHKVYNSNTIEDKLKLQILDIDLEKLELIMKIVYETDAKIVISSSWRKLRIWPLLEDYLISKGLPIIDVTPKLNDRGEEIRTYLKEHSKIDTFIILDDEVFKDFYELENYLIKTDFYDEGLTEEDANEAIKILKRK